MTRCKFKCESVTNTENGAEILMRPVTKGGEENEKFFKWTPYGELKIGTVNPEVAKKLIPGKEYYIDITMVKPL